MRLELTDLSEQTYRTIGAVGKDPLSAIDFLRSDIQIREFYPSLRQLYPESDIKERLVNGFSEISPDTERASVIRRVQNWINGKNVPSGREDIFIIAFSLHLSEEDVSYLLGFVSDYGIHYRSPEELAYSYCLRTGRTYPEAVRFFRDLPLLQKLQGFCAAILSKSIGIFLCMGQHFSFGPVHGLFKTIFIHSKRIFNSW